MNRQTSLWLALLLALTMVSSLYAQPEELKIWPGLAPGETAEGDDLPSQWGDGFDDVTVPRLLIYTPAQKKSNACILIFPGGGYSTCFYGNEGCPNGEWWANQGVTAAVLIYRVPRPKTAPIYARAWQDAQRAIRVIRANADRLGIDPEKIGAQGYSAGGHLTMMAACASQTPAYEPVDEIDQLPCHLNFAMPVYVPYALTDGRTEQNTNGGIGAELLAEDFRFDEKTPPLCLTHGDNDVYSPIASIEIYRKLHEMKIPCELHIYQGAPHGFMFWDNLPNAKNWRDRCLDWMISIDMF